MMNSNPDHYTSSTDGTARKARIQGALSSCTLFKAASAATLEIATNTAVFDTVPRAKPILQQGSAASGLVLILRGRARVERALISGDVLPLGYRGAGEIVGEASLVTNENHTENVIAMDDCDVIRIPANTMSTLLRTDSVIAQALVSIVLQRQTEAEDRLTSLLFRPVEGRVVEFLLLAANRWGVADPRGTLISAPVTHLEIAKAIGSTRETVTVTLGILRRDGLLDVAGRRLIVVDRAALAKRK